MWKNKYQLIFEMFNFSINNKLYEEEFLQVKIRFNKETFCGKITEFVVLQHGFLITYETNADLILPSCALARFSRFCIEDLLAASNAVLNRRLFHEVEAISLI